MALHSSVFPRSYNLTTNTKTVEIIQGETVFQSATVVERRKDGLATLQPLGGSCPTVNAGAQSVAIGEVVHLPGVNAQQSGGTGLGASIFSGGGILDFLERQEPISMPTGSTTAVTYFGGGFDGSFSLQYLLPVSFWSDFSSPEVHPGIAITNFVIVDFSTATADVVVDQDAVWENDLITGLPILGPVEYFF